MMGTTAEKLAYLANTKADIRAAMVEKGIEVPQSTPFRKYAEKIAAIPSKMAQTYIPGKENQIIDAGQYLKESQTIQGDANLLPENIVSGKSIFGVAGSASSGIQDISIQQNLYSLGDSFDVYYQIKYRDHGGITQTKTVTIRRNYSQSLQIEGEILSIYVYINA
nr:MAG TPA: tail protein [Caudoviricetes sp.]